MVKAEMGDEAVILSTARRRIKDSSSGTATSIVEVVAAMDFDVEALSSKGHTQSGGHARQPAGNILKNRVQGNLTLSSGNTEAGNTKRPSPVSDGSSKPQADKSEVSAVSPFVRPENAHSMESFEKDVLRREITELRSLVEKMLNFGITQEHGKEGAGPGTDWSEARGGMLSSSRYPLMVMQEVFDFLGMDPSIQRGLASAFLKAHPSARPVNHRTVYSWLRNYCSQGIVRGPLAHTADMPCWWAFIGPTGVGKTTTLAKVAAHLKFRHGLRGHLVTVDTYRLGGVEQLRKYAALMEIPFSTAKNSGELVRIFSDNRDLDFILVDTIGRNSSSSQHHLELGKMFDAVPGLMAQAFLCATYRSEDMAETVRTYRQFPVCGWTISKTDETGSPGALCTPVLGWRLPLSYITNGQKVPEDIKIATRENVMELLFSKGDARFTADRGSVHVNHAGNEKRDIAAGHAANVEGQR